MAIIGLTPSLEDEFIKKGYSHVIGVDEVGRGSWAGPLVVGAFVYQANIEIIDGVNDSKILTSHKRECLEKRLKLNLHKVEIGEIREIDSYNIVEATRRAIIRAVRNLELDNFFVLVDGYFKKGFNFEHECIKKGDAKHYSIAAASIVAKVYRDNLMRNLARTYPQYGFETNVGYGTKKHRDALKKFGICKIHRRTFHPMVSMV